MPLESPPPPPRLSQLPGRRLGGRRLWRVVRRGRAPWWFSSVDQTDASGSGRFDLPAPHGACYLATSKLASVLGAVQAFGHGLLPDVELRRRRVASLVAPHDVPSAAQLTAARARGVGVTAALWAGGDRALTQRWAESLHRAGWRALYHGIQHDPAGRMRGVTLLDRAGAHPPYDDADGWHVTLAAVHDDQTVRAGLARYGIQVERSDPEPTLVPLHETDLL